MGVVKGVGQLRIKACLQLPLFGSCPGFGPVRIRISLLSRVVTQSYSPHSGQDSGLACGWQAVAGIAGSATVGDDENIRIVAAYLRQVCGF
jgi:hypothetical protein